MTLGQISRTALRTAKCMKWVLFTPATYSHMNE